MLLHRAGWIYCSRRLLSPQHSLMLQKPHEFVKQCDVIGRMLVSPTNVFDRLRIS